MRGTSGGSMSRWIVVIAVALAIEARADEGSCVPVDLAREVPALLATTLPEPDQVGADAWLSLEDRFRQNLPCSSLLDRRDLATLYLGAANVVSISDPARCDRYLADYVRLASDAPRRFSLDGGTTPIGIIPTAETQATLAALSPGSVAHLSTRAQVWLDGRGLRPGDVVELPAGDHVLQQVGATVSTRSVLLEPGRGYELVRPQRGLRAGLAAAGGVMVAAGVASLVWGYGPAQRQDDVDGSRNGAIAAWLGAGVGLAAVGAGGLVAAAAWTPDGEVQVRLSGRFE